MGKHLRSVAGSFLLVAAMAGLWSSTLSPPAVGQGPQGPTAAQIDEAGPEENAIDKIAGYMDHRFDYTTMQLKRLGFDPSNPEYAIDQKAWKALPSPTKIAIAYQYAQAASPENGQKMLAMLSRNLAQQYGPILEEPELKRFGNDDAFLGFGEILEFKRPPQYTSPAELAASLTELPVEVKEAIVKISEYVRPNTLGSPTKFVERHTGLSKASIFDIFAKSATTGEALQRAILQVDPERRQAAVQSMVKHVTDRFEAASYEKSFKPYMGNGPSPDGPTSVVDGTGPRRDGPPGTNRAEINRFRADKIPPGELANRRPETSGAVRKFNEVMKQNYPTPADRRYRDATSEVKGFGGIMLGNTVEADKTLPKPVSMTFVPEDNRTSGRLVIRLADGTERSFSSVLAEDAYAAYQMTLGSYEGAPSWKPGEAIGLVGLENPEYRHFLEYGPTEVTEWLVKKIVLHPALLDLELGNMAILTDATPRYARSTLYEAVEEAKGPDARAEVEQVFGIVEEYLSSSGYLFVDVPLRLLDEGDRVALMQTPANGESALPEGLLRSSFLELRVMTNPSAESYEDRYDRDFAAEFNRILPVLAESHYAIHRINRFVPVLALYRWAKQEGASCEAPPRPEGSSTPDELLVGAGYEWGATDVIIKPANSELVEDQRNGGMRSLDARIAELETDAALKPHLERLERVLAKWIAQDSAEKEYYDLPVGEDEAAHKEYMEAQKEFTEAQNVAFEQIIDDDVRQKARYWLELKRFRE